MKKLLTLLITGAMLLSTFSITAYADTTVEINNKNDASATVTAKYQTVGADYWNDVEWDDATIAVNVTWTNTNYVYNFGTVWNAEDHKYEEGSGWNNQNKLKVSVENHSNCPVNVNLANINKIEGLTLNFADNKTSAQLTSAINEADVNAERNQTEFNLTFDYKPESYVNTASDLFSFDVVISDVNNS